MSSKNEIINIVMICDENYVIPTAVTITSIKENKNKENIYTIYILSNDLSNQSKQTLENLESDNLKISIIYVDIKLKVLVNKNIHVSKASLIKFKIADTLLNLDKILYLDCDIIVRKDLSEIFNIDLLNCYAGVVKDYIPMTYNIKQTQALGVNHKYYFNSGVMLLNLSKLREEKIYDRLVDYRINGYNIFMDQDAFNVVFEENVKYISLEFNLMSHMVFNVPFEELYNYYELKSNLKLNQLLDNTVIIHMCSRYKPWNYNNIPFASIWYYYYQKTNLKYKLKLTNLNNDLLNKNFSILKNSYWEKVENAYLFDTKECTVKEFEDIIFNYKELIIQCKEYNFSYIENTIETLMVNVFKQFTFLNKNDKKVSINILKNFTEYLNCELGVSLQNLQSYAKLKVINSYDTSFDYNFNNIIPIVFATNKDYLPFMSVALESLVENSSNNNLYKIYVIHSELLVDHEQKIKEQFGDSSNIILEFINVSKIIDSKIMYGKAYFTKEMYYRILIPSLLPMYEKVIYLDCDLILDVDIAELYLDEIGENYISAVKNITSSDMAQYLRRNFQFEFTSYFNSGILVFNVEKILLSNAEKVFLELLQMNKNFRCPDQDALNILFYNKVNYLCSGWNFQVYHFLDDAKIKLDSQLSDSITIFNQNLEDEKIKIYHFISHIKPWLFPEKKYSHIFWKYARKTYFYEEVLYKKIEINENNNNTTNNNKHIKSNISNKDYKRINGQLKWARSELKKVRSERLEYKKEVNNIKHSKSYRFSRFVSFIPRTLRNIFTKDNSKKED